MERLGSHWTACREILNLTIFRKSVENILVSLKPDKNNGYFTSKSMHIYDSKGKGKVIPLQARCGPEGG